MQEETVISHNRDRSVAIDVNFRGRPICVCTEAVLMQAVVTELSVLDYNILLNVALNVVTFLRRIYNLHYFHSPCISCKVF